MYSTDLGCPLLRCYATPHRRLRRGTLMCLMLLMAGMIKEGHFCDVIELRESYHVISSSGYPEFYIPNKDPCSWRFIADQNKTVSIRFKDVDLPPPSNNSCIQDYVELNEESFRNEERICGSTVPSVKTSVTNILIVKFDAFGENTMYRGFYAEIFESEVTILSSITHKGPQVPEVKIKCPNDINKINGKTAIAFIVSRFTDFVRQNYTTIFKSDGAAQGNLSGIEVEEKLSGLQVEGDLKSGLTATLETPTCTDTGIYKCTIVYQYNATAEATMEEITPVNIIFPPTTTNVVVVNPLNCHAVESTVSFKCTADIGSMKNGTIKRLVWQMATKSDNWEKMNVNQGVTTYGSGTPCNLSPENEISYVLTVNDVGADYRCIVEEHGIIDDVYFMKNDDAQATPVSLSEVRDTRLPTNVTMSVEPMKESYEEKEKLMMSCTCSIGKEVAGLQTKWLWERKRTNETAWQNYNENVETDEPLEYTDRPCDRMQTTKITLRVAAEDIQRVYRCYVVKEMEGQMESFERLGASYIIKAVNIIETPEDPEASGSNLTMILGGAVGILLLLIILAIIIFSFCLRKKEPARRPTQKAVPGTRVSVEKEGKPSRVSQMKAKPSGAPSAKPSGALSVKAKPSSAPSARPSAAPSVIMRFDRKMSSSVDWPRDRRPSSSVDHIPILPLCPQEVVQLKH